MAASQLVLDYGYACTESNESFTTVLNQANALPLSPSTVADLMIALSKSREIQNGEKSWNLAIVKNVFSGNLEPGFSIKVLLQNLDNNWELKELQDFYLFMELLTIFFNESPLFTFLHFPWNYKKGILTLISFWIQVENSGLDKPFNGTIIPNNRKIISSHFQESFWNNLDLIGFLWEMGNSKELEGIVGNIFLEGSNSCPEVIMLGFSKLNWTNSSPFKDVLQSLLLLFLQGHASSGVVLPALWQSSPSLFITGILAYYASDPSSLSRILDLAQDLKILGQVLEAESFNFSIDLAGLASRREYLNLEKWLIDHIREKGLPFFLAILDFLREKIAVSSGRLEGKPPSVPLSIDVAGVFIRTILHNKQYFYYTNISILSPDKVQVLRETLAACVQTWPQLESGISAILESASSNNNTAGINPQAPATFPQDIEEEANSYYERIYKGEVSIPQIVEILSRFKNSNFPREQQVFKCMIHNLFDEYQFFPRYPDKELAITSILFGSLIQNQIISSIALGVALRYVLEALRQPIGSKLFNFASQALYQFQSRLVEWPQYCTLLLQIPHLPQAMPDVMQKIGRVLNQNGTGQSFPPETVPDVGSLPRQASSPQIAPVFSALKVDADSEGSAETPDDSVHDKILFIMNNLSTENMNVKISEMREIFGPSHFRWFSGYIVKRASQEPNYHSLYSDFLDALSSNVLERHIIHETFSNVHVLLNSEKTVASSQERTLLKNLGTWLGLVTLSKNKPIKHRNLAMKELLLEGYDSSRLIVVIPFVCKVLEQGYDSVVFSPPNPWLMAIMKLLAELYHYANLKLNLKFEIEVLCKKLNLDIKDIQPTDILRNRPLKDYGTKQADADNSLQTSSDNSGQFYSNISTFLTFNSNIPIFNTQPALKRIVQIAIERAIREVVTSPVVERSVAIATIASRELVLKDFALEGNDEKMRKAAHLMVQSLSGSLASVSTREPLRVSIIAHIKNLLLQNGFTEVRFKFTKKQQSVPEQVIYVVVADNLELACSIMEKTAAEKSIAEVDDALSQAYVLRRKHRERSTQPFYDMSVLGASRYPSLLPESLKLKPGGLTLSQIRVYEDFMRISVPGSPAPDSERVARAAETHFGGQASEQPAYDNAPAAISTQQATENFLVLMAELERNVSQNSNASLQALNANHVLRALIRQVPLLVTQAANRDDCALLFSQNIVQQLYKSDNKLSTEINLLILEKLCEISKRFFKELKEWLLYDDNEKKFDVSVTILLLERGFVTIQEPDLQLCRLIEVGRPPAISYACNLIRSCLLSEAPLCSYNSFLLSVEALRRSSVEAHKNIASAVQFGLGQKMAQLAENENMIDNSDFQKIKEQIIAVYKEWIQLYGHPASNERNQLNYVALLQANNLLIKKNITPMFLRVAIEATIEAYTQSSSLGASSAAAYQTVDALARLFVLIIIHQPDEPNSEPCSGRNNLLNLIFSVIPLVIAHNHEQNRTSFNQKPFFRLFSSMICGFSANREALEPVEINLFSALGNMLHLLNPSILPGFSFSWVQIVSHRFFFPKLIQSDRKLLWIVCKRLLVDLLEFLNPYLTRVPLSNTIRIFYKAALRIMLVLVHDFPEFLCEYHFDLVNVVPYSCVQLRNLILSAFPQEMKLPDPFTPNLKVDLLPEINQSPTILSDYTSSLVELNLLEQLDTYLETRSPQSFLNGLSSRFLLESSVTEAKYDIKAISSLVLYMGIKAISISKAKTNIPDGISNAPLDIFQSLADDMDSESRYYLFSAVADQLRYPNSHTHYFSCILLHIFSETQSLKIQEQITRVLIERLIVNRPHPYGLLITFIELIRNPRYKFWDLSIIHCAPEIERIFSNVAKSIVNKAG